MSVPYLGQETLNPYSQNGYGGQDPLIHRLPNHRRRNSYDYAPTDVVRNFYAIPYKQQSFNDYDAYGFTAQERSQEHLATLKQQVEDTKRRKQQQYLREQEEDRILEDNIRKQREKMRLEYEAEQAKYKMKQEQLEKKRQLQLAHIDAVTKRNQLAKMKEKQEVIKLPEIRVTSSSATQEDNRIPGKNKGANPRKPQERTKKKASQPKPSKDKPTNNNDLTLRFDNLGSKQIREEKDGKRRRMPNKKNEELNSNEPTKSYIYSTPNPSFNRDDRLRKDPRTKGRRRSKNKLKKIKREESVITDDNLLKKDSSTITGQSLSYIHLSPSNVEDHGVQTDTTVEQTTTTAKEENETAETESLNHQEIQEDLEIDEEEEIKLEEEEGLDEKFEELDLNSNEELPPQSPFPPPISDLPSKEDTLPPITEPKKEFNWNIELKDEDLEEYKNEIKKDTVEFKENNIGPMNQFRALLKGLGGKSAAKENITEKEDNETKDASIVTLNPISSGKKREKTEKLRKINSMLDKTGEEKTDVQENILNLEETTIDFNATNKTTLHNYLKKTKKSQRKKNSQV